MARPYLLRYTGGKAFNENGRFCTAPFLSRYVAYVTYRQYQRGYAESHDGACRRKDIPETLPVKACYGRHAGSGARTLASGCFDAGSLHDKLDDRPPVATAAHSRTVGVGQRSPSDPISARSMRTA